MTDALLPPPAPRCRRRPPHDGFTLLEALIALVLVGIALLLPLSLLAQDVRVSERLDAEHAVRQHLQRLLELLRAGVLPLRSERVDATTLPETGDIAIDVDLLVAETATPNLHRVELVARYEVRGVELEQRSFTLLWRPP